MGESHELTPIDLTLRKAAATLHDAQVPFVLGGSLACWARGGPRTLNDVDLMVAPQDVDAALAALGEAGMRAERPPETWLVKAHDGDVSVDIIFSPLGVVVDHEYIAGCDEFPVLAISMHVMSVEDVLVSRLLAIDEHRIEYTPLVAIARALREQIDWSSLGARVSESPYARAFLTLAEELGIAGPSRASHRVRVHRLELG